MFIGNVEIQNPVVLAPMAERYRPAISSVMQKKWTAVFCIRKWSAQRQFYTAIKIQKH